MNEGFVLVHMHIGSGKDNVAENFRKNGRQKWLTFHDPKRYTIFSERTREVVVNQTNTETTKVGIKNDCLRSKTRSKHMKSSKECYLLGHVLCFVLIDSVRLNLSCV